MGGKKKNLGNDRYRKETRSVGQLFRKQVIDFTDPVANERG